MSIYIEGASYNNNVSVKSVYHLFKHKLENRYDIEYVLEALDIFTDKSDKVPHPSDIISIIEEVKRKKNGYKGM